MHQLLEKKFKKVFKFFDSDHNGCIGKTDYHTMADKFASSLGIPLESPIHHELKKSMLLVWTRLCTVLNINEDSIISLNEFLTAEDARKEFHRNLKPDEYHDTIAFFNLMDITQQGFITVDEYTLAFTIATDIAEAEAIECFKILDINKDGRITLPELISLWAEFFNSTDEAAPGNSLFGRIN